MEIQRSVKEAVRCKFLEIGCEPDKVAGATIRLTCGDKQILEKNFGLRTPPSEPKPGIDNIIICQCCIHWKVEEKHKLPKPTRAAW